MILDLTISVEYVGIFSVAIGLHIFKSGGDKIRVSNSGGDMSPPLIDAYGSMYIRCFIFLQNGLCEQC